MFTRVAAAFVAYRHYRSNFAQLFFLQSDFVASIPPNNRLVPYFRPNRTGSPAAATAAFHEYFLHREIQIRQNVATMSRKTFRGACTVANHFIIARSPRSNFTPSASDYTFFRFWRVNERFLRIRFFRLESRAKGTRRSGFVLCMFNAKTPTRGK